MAAQETDIIHQRTGSRAPQHAYGACIDAARENSEAADDIGAPRRRKDHGPRRAHALITGRAIEKVELRQSRMQADQHCVRFQSERVADYVMSTRKIEDPMR